MTDQPEPLDVRVANAVDSFGRDLPFPARRLLRDWLKSISLFDANHPAALGCLAALVCAVWGDEWQVDIMTNGRDQRVVGSAVRLLHVDGRRHMRSAEVLGEALVQLGTAGAGMDVVSDVDAALGRLVSGAQSPNRAALPGEPAASPTPVVKAREWDAGIHRTLGADGFPSDVVPESEADRWAELALDLGARCADLRRALAVAEGRLAYRVVVDSDGVSLDSKTVARIRASLEQGRTIIDAGPAVSVTYANVGHRDVLDSGLTLAQCEAWLTANGWALASDPAQRWRCWSKPGHRDRWILPDHDQWPHQQAAGIAVLVEAVAEEAGRAPAEVLAEMLATEVDDG